MKFGANICENGRVMAKSVIFNMAAAAILDLAVYQFCINNQLRNPIFCLCVKFGVNPFKNGWVMAV